MPHSFAPLIDKRTKVMIIGSMPGEASLQANEYYAHPRNLLWEIISISLNDGKKFYSYANKTMCLLENRIGLWDSLQFCERIGSLDNNIKNAAPNNFARLLDDYPNVEKLLFNGQKSFQFFKKFHQPILEQMEYITLPSTSPANASICFEQKLEIWRKSLKA